MKMEEVYLEIDRVKEEMPTLDLELKPNMVGS